MTISLPFKLDLGGNDNAKGVTLALSSGLFIGASFIIKKKGLQAAGNSGGQRVADGGFAYLREPLWWLGLITMIGGEAANFAAYAYAPAIVVTPLGATTIIVTALLAWCMLGERLHECGILGCLMCVLGSVVLVSFAPEEGELHSMEEIWALATQPQFLTYCAVVVALSVLISFRCGRYGETNVLVYISICSLMGSLSVVSCKALGIALKLTFKGHNQLAKRETYVFVFAVVVCIATQMNYLNKALDTFNTAMVSSIYYVFFTVCTISASTIMYKDWENLPAHAIGAQLASLLVLMLGVYVLQATKDTKPGCAAGRTAILVGSVASTKEVAEYVHLLPGCKPGDEGGTEGPRRGGGGDESDGSSCESDVV